MDFEQLGSFYLGRRWDVEQRASTADLVLYDSRDLVTHAVCVGMTGSGKTGLCLALIEEAALDRIPAIVIDPKGDLGNLLLTFPELRPEDFAPWINEDEARRQGVTPEAYARQQAERWRQGLAGWGQDGARIRRLRESVDLAIYTPGSAAGLPVSILRSFAAPTAEARADAEALRERVAVTATGLLGLIGIEADPVKSREHILLSVILDTAWRAGRDLDLAALIEQIQSPPVARVGVLDLETFYPARERFELALALNNLLASPGFGTWLEGEPLDVASLLHTPAGQPRVSIMSIAHLGERERMFFVSLLLNQVAGWMRAQPGTTSLRAILYMDEIFGFFPPVANPPAKPPLLTLLKQARAYGLGVVLATQNPADLDYKGLANAGTWFIGRLQTERDKARVLEGLEGAVSLAGRGVDRAGLDRLISGLAPRQFLLHDVHEDGPVVFESRWALSYLRGPLTRDHIRRLMSGRRASAPAAPVAGSAAGSAAPPSDAERDSGVLGRAPGPQSTAGPAQGEVVPQGSAAGSAGGGGLRPVLPPDIPQVFVPARGPRADGARLVYEPRLIGVASIRFADARRGVDEHREVAVLAPITGEAVAVDWESAQTADLTAGDLEAEPAGEAQFASLPPAASRAASYRRWNRELGTWLHRTQRLPLFALDKAVSRPGESERDFRLRLQQAAREQRDAAAERLRETYAPRIAALQEKIRRAEQAVARESEQAAQSGLQTAISVGATILGAFLGRKTVSASTLGRATTAARGAGRVLKERQDVGRAQETLDAQRQQLADLEAAFEAEAARLGDAAAPLTAELTSLGIAPTRQNVSVRLLALAWTPSGRGVPGSPRSA